MRTESQRYEAAARSARERLEIYWIKTPLQKGLTGETPQEYADINCTLAFKDWFDLRRRYPRCAYCNRLLGEGNYAMDHIVPISRGGSHSKDNVLPICRPCNRAKHNSLLGEWLPWDWFPS